MGMTDQVINTSKNKYRQWRNGYNVLINCACFSCRWADVSDINGLRKQCQLERKEDAIHPRDYCCRAWEAKEVYRYVGGTRRVDGGLAKPAPVKTRFYLEWWRDNYKEFGCFTQQGRDEFKRQYPHKSIFIKE